MKKVIYILVFILSSIGKARVENFPELIDEAVKQEVQASDFVYQDVGLEHLQFHSVKIKENKNIDLKINITVTNN